MNADRYRAAADLICERNARTIRRADAAANIVMAIVLGVVAAVALMHACGWLL